MREQSVRRAEVSGTYRQIGQQLGELFKGDWSDFLNRRFDVMTSELHSIGVPFCRGKFATYAAAILRSLEQLTPNEFSELMGIAEATNLEVADLVLALGYTDVFDLFAVPASPCQSGQLWAEDKPHECTSFIVKDSVGSFRCGQTWDMPIETADFAALVLKRPTGGQPYYSYSLLGGLAYIGINSDGLCIGTTKVTSRDIGTGVFFPALVQAALAESALDDAVNLLSVLPKVSGHYFYLVSPTRASACEVSANKCEAWAIETNMYVHTNHYDNVAFRDDELAHSQSSAKRCGTMTRCIVESGGTLTLDDYRVYLSDHGTGLCRHGDDSETLVTITGTSVYLEPDRRLFHYSDGPPCREQWVEAAL
jgi:hypothetical protein